MKTITTVTLIGSIDGTPERKTVNGKALTEFRVAEIGLRISAWEARAELVPDSGTVVVSGYLSSRTYKHEGADRVATEVRATNVQVLDTAPAIDDDLPF